ncbi:hypothetical protein QFC24_001087 [Naganishia onofrii]|uniref:Uncharacterized protein n=1 Tax=Naganishia onofrii TaxID=1851511 RepID=A0ACC2XWM6_9TREE|nr:hypothetical protein QFC24_001087 [Naganishia onofrii]
MVSWVRPPDINLNGVTMPTNALQINAANSSLSINFDLAIRQVYNLFASCGKVRPAYRTCPYSATNPNWFSAKFKEISAV